MDHVEDGVVSAEADAAPRIDRHDHSAPTIFSEIF